MPTVPRLSDDRVQQGGFSGGQVGISAPPSAFGGGQAVEEATEAIQGVTGVAQAYLAKQQERADDLAILGFDRAASEERLAIQREAKNHRGKNALGYGEVAEKRVTDLTKRLEQEALTPNQKMAVAGILNKLRASSSEIVEGHTSREVQKFEDDEFRSSQKNRIDFALETMDDIGTHINDQIESGALDPVRDWETIRDLRKQATDPILGRESMEYRQLAEKRAERLGLGKETTAEYVRTLMSAFHGTVIKRFLQGKEGEAADEYYKANSEEMTAEDKAQVSGIIQDMASDQKAQRASDKVLKETKTLQQGLDEINKIQDPYQREKIRNMYMSDYRLQQMAENERKDRTFNSLYDMLNKNGGDLDALPPGAKESLDAEQEENLDRFAAQESQRLVVGNEPLVIEKFNAVTDEQIAEIPDEKLPAFEAEFRTRLSKPWFEYVQDRIKAVRSGAKERKERIEKGVTDAEYKQIDEQTLGYMQTGKAVRKFDKLTPSEQYELMNFRVRFAGVLKSAKAKGPVEMEKLLNQEWHRSEVTKVMVDGTEMSLLKVPADLVDEASIPYENILPSDQERLRGILRMRVPENYGMDDFGKLTEAGEEAIQKDVEKFRFLEIHSGEVVQMPAKGESVNAPSDLRLLRLLYPTMRPDIAQTPLTAAEIATGKKMTMEDVKILDRRRDEAKTKAERKNADEEFDEGIEQFRLQRDYQLSRRLSGATAAQAGRGEEAERLEREARKRR